MSGCLATFGRPNVSILKKILFLILAGVVILAAIVGLYTSFDHSEVPPADALKAIPQSAALIFETGEAGALWQDLSQYNLMWEELQATDYFFRLNAAAEALDSLFTSQKEVRRYFANKPLAVSVHVSGSRDFDFIFSMPVKEDMDSKKLLATLPQILRTSKQPEQRLYDGVNLYAVESTLTGTKVFFFKKDGLLVLSKSSILAEEAIRALEQDASVLHSPEFMAVRKTRGLKTRGELYINYKVFKTILAQNVSRESARMDFFQRPYAEWSALDLKLKPNAVSLNGFVLCKDSSDAWLGSFRDTKAPPMQVLRYMPSNTAFFVFLGFGDFQKFRSRQMHIFGRTNQKYDVEHKLQVYGEKCNCDMHEAALSWIGSQAASFITEPAAVQYSQNHFAVFKADNINDAWDKLCSLEEKINIQNNHSTEIETFNDHEIHRLRIGNFYSSVLSEAFEGLKDPYFTRMDNMILMSTSLNGMRTLIQKIRNNYESENTLASDKRFLELSDQISGNSHFLIYSSLARSPYVYQNILNEKHAAAIEKQTELLRKFQAFVYQVGYYKSDLYYNNVYLKYNPQFKKETGSLWEKKLDAPVNSKPVFVKNHYTGALEIFVQDVNNTVYLIANTGKILWKLPVDGPIRSEVVQVDVYRNEKLQMLFSTEKSIYLLDRNGNNVESYPVRLPANATNGVTVADYDNSRHYRFFIAVDGGRILCYDVNGKQIEGWDFTSASANITSEVRALRIKSKDYIFALDASGKIHLLNRRGEPRHIVTETVKHLAPGKIKFDLQNNISSSGIFFVDSAGNAFRQGFNDRFSKIGLTKNTVLDYDFVDIDKDGTPECVLLTPGKLEAYTLSGKNVFRNSLPESNREKLQTFLFPDNEVRFCVTDPEHQKVTLYTSAGNVYDGFPLFGSTPVAIGDMNLDNTFNLITVGQEGFLVAYSLE